MIKEFMFGTSRGFEIQNDALKVKLISYGARITELHFDGKDVTLGFDRLEDYKESNIYCGAVVGRFGNRIANGRFSLNGTEYQLPKNEKGITTLHGGTEGFDRFEWDGEILSDNAVRFSRLSRDGEMGFPGNLAVSVTYTLEKDGLCIAYFAKTDADTHVNLTNHAYFNLDGCFGEDCLKMTLQLDAPKYLPVDDKLIPTGEIADVAGTIFDRRDTRPIETDYDHCFVFGMKQEYKKVGTLYSPHSGIAMDIETDMPGLQCYTCSGTNEKAGKGGVPLHLHHAVALETQFFPDTPNHENFPSTLLQASAPFESITRYRFYKK